MNKLYLSIVIPSYNEENNIRTGSLSGMVDYLKEQDYSWEILVVDDGSTDKTAELALKFAETHKNIRVLKEPHRGKGGTVIAGMLKAIGEIVIFDDMDQATPIDQLEKILPKFREKYDVVIGSRAGREGAPLIRKTMALGLSILRNIVLQLPYKDTQCGFKAFTKPASEKIFKKLQIFNNNQAQAGASVSAGFDLEILYVARKLKLKITEVPVVWHHKEGTKVNPIKDSWEGLRDLLKIRINAIKGIYR
ncbi:MAG: Glycosyl transferase family 2 [Candidatus Woesebacteria bacterium GW2011_GWA1_33_30]|uniref:dolichyl-phosphate beta-glucosyltransferase n=1 Tax=Candidatus Woesebacteria bacterium GW2011_GWA2_33_28 TaxID=1618561 RepID=A0A0G0AAF6_9BACT|nr:MAG: Glycosyl transferase family 2 [Candidatus Woesebacteria bacterium GW2011_GWA2_33_28]KKP49038.1 MAG: Glycosyl transferase family 2 [Candidatus Woesebacteria bacterium GW2011_GWA1_33_30]KKP49854.1 MAG: Glycosyl transferase family 2 [Microgenomates group bacterium GW2011_GWC1_33_32]KKP52630.1 MAG: Glycosyl transferase family 2 [Candidatus Woesebacteria bacterium GW2011_GWB1_33_38]KKP58807.1 MAG: Glycosyl transferase family 2 [Microgenomates group bacterium GW2011_GWD1_33_9]